MSAPPYPPNQYGGQPQSAQPAYPPPGGYGNPVYPPPVQPGYQPPPSTGYQPPPESYPASFPPPPSYDSAIAKPLEQPSSYGDGYDVEYGGAVSFSDKSIRMGFIRRVYFILMIQLSVTVATICLFLFYKPVRNFVHGKHGAGNTVVYVSAFVVFFVLYFVIACCESVRRKYPVNLICLAIFTLALSYLVGTISSYHDTNIVLIMMGVTTLVCLSVMIFSCQTKYDFTTWGGVLFCAALAIFFLSIFTPVWLLLNTTAGKIVLGGVLALVFVAFLAYDTQLIMGGKKYELSPEEYIFGALTLYMDIIRIFLLLLALFGKK
ncbi:predicted protein [Nematostella vectensis]|uniref:Uncharacterized protein n=1 Tax=Nematostella vectensis TaxID=45351 RepID=A7RG77_NEMVE|nr:protein lifeguard 1 [Nematostella vectensis]EDO49375.1 predicted protein [Nematostella vectensis]|eukprot:XP_001641438.1 predicted protein [Nematostella vectensis]